MKSRARKAVPSSTTMVREPDAIVRVTRAIVDAFSSDQRKVAAPSSPASSISMRKSRLSRPV